MGRMIALAAAVLALTGAAPQPSPSAEDIARSLQARYDTIKTFTADYTHTVTSAIVPQGDTNRGTVLVKKPGRLNFTTTSPAATQTVSDGVWLISWDGGKQADRVHLTQDDPSTLLMFLAGRGNLPRDFTPSLPAPQPDGEWRLVLAPKTPQPDFVSIALIVDRRTLALDGYETVDGTGSRTTMHFSNLKENVALPDSDFTFNHRGVKIVDR